MGQQFGYAPSRYSCRSALISNSIAKRSMNNKPFFDTNVILYAFRQDHTRGQSLSVKWRTPVDATPSARIYTSTVTRHHHGVSGQLDL